MSAEELAEADRFIEVWERAGYMTSTEATGWRERIAVWRRFGRKGRLQLSNAFNDSEGRFASIAAPLRSRFTRQSPIPSSAGRVSGQHALRRTITEYLAHYHRERNHQGLNNRLIDPAGGEGRIDGAIQCRE